MIKKKWINLIILVLVALFIIGLCFFPKLQKKSKPSLLISEVCVHNDKAAHDEYGDYGADYIEIYNCSDEPVNLFGWGLSDSGVNLGKYKFPDITVEPSSAIIAWCSEDKYQPDMFRDDYVPTDVHGLGFNLSDGETCVLSDRYGNAVSTVRISDHFPENKTLSVSNSDLSSYVVDDATPYFVKDEIVAEEKKELIEAPVFSVDGGWFDSDVTVELTSSVGDIYYTLDGSDPDENSLKYEGAITISNRTEEGNYYSAIDGIDTECVYYPDYPVDKATVLRAVAISPDGESNIESRTFFVGLDPEEYSGVSVMSIVASPDALFDQYSGIYRVGSVHESFYKKIDDEKLPSSFVPVANCSRKGKGWERAAKIEFYTPDHESGFSQTVGIRTHGGFSSLLNQKSLNLYARNTYDGNDFFNWDFYGDGNQYDKIVLRNGGGGEELYLAKMRDVFNQSLAGDRAVGIQNSIPCVLFLNGEYWGLYNLQEKACDNYVWNHYGVSEDNVVVVKKQYGSFAASDEEDAAYADDYMAVLDYVKQHDMSVDENYRFVESKIDIQSMIDYYALKIYVGCSDAFFNNEVVWRAKVPESGQFGDGKWRWLANDLDDSTSLSEGMNTPDVDSFVLGNWYSKTGPLVDDVLLSGLMNNPEFKQRFVTSFLDMTNNNFRYEKVAPKLWTTAEVVRVQNVKSQVRFRGEYNFDYYPGREMYEAPYDEFDFGYDIGLIDAFYSQRAGYMLGYLKEDLGLSGNLYNLKVVGDASTGLQLKINTSEITDFSGEWNGSYYSDYPVVLECTPGDEATGIEWYVNGGLVSSDKYCEIPAGVEGDVVVEIR